MTARVTSRKPVDTVFRERMSNLYQSIGRAFLAGSVDQHTYNLAMQLFARMVSQGRDEITFTLREAHHSLAMRGSTVVCGVLPIDEMFEFYTHGAMQACQKSFGLLIARSQEELARGIKEFAETAEMPTNFTAWPYDEDTDDWNYANRDQTLVCKLVWDQGQAWQEVIKDYVDRSSRKLFKLPKWIPRLEL